MILLQENPDPSQTVPEAELKAANVVGTGVLARRLSHRRAWEHVNAANVGNKLRDPVTYFQGETKPKKKLSQETSGSSWLDLFHVSGIKLKDSILNESWRSEAHER